MGGGNGIVLRPSLKLLWRWRLKQYLLSSTASLPMWNTIISVQFSHSVTSDYLRHHGLQHARPPCPSPTPGVYSNSCPLSQWCHPTISSSVIPFSSCLQSFPASGSFQMSQFFASGTQSIGVSASASVFPVNIQDWSFGWTGWISLQSKGLSRVFFNTIDASKASILQHLAFFIFQLLHTHLDYWKNHSFDKIDPDNHDSVITHLEPDILEV